MECTLQACRRSCLILLLNKQRRTLRAPQPQIYLFHNSWLISASVRALDKTSMYRAEGLIDHSCSPHTHTHSLCKDNQGSCHAGFLLAGLMSSPLTTLTLSHSFTLLRDSLAPSFTHHHLTLCTQEHPCWVKLWLMPIILWQWAY